MAQRLEEEFYKTVNQVVKRTDTFQMDDRVDDSEQSVDVEVAKFNAQENWGGKTSPLNQRKWRNSWGNSEENQR